MRQQNQDFGFFDSHCHPGDLSKAPKGSLGHNGITKHNLGTEGYKN